MFRLFRRYSVLGLTLLGGATTVALAQPQPLELTPRDLLFRAFTKNLDLQVQLLEVDISRDREIIAGEDLVPQFTVRLSRDSSQSALNQREFFGAGGIRIFEEDAWSAGAGVSALMPYGTLVELETNSTRLKNSTNRRPDSPFFPEVQSSARVVLTQPLLRGRGSDFVLAPLRLQESTTRATEWDTRASFEQIAAQLLLTAWENQFALDNIRVKEEAVELAQTLARENRRRVEEGMMADIDVTQAEVRVAEAREELIRARSLYRERQDVLWNLTSDEGDLDRIPIRVVGLEEALPELETERVNLLRTMLERNPIYRGALAQAEAENIRVAFAENLQLPQIDLRASLGYNGLDDGWAGSISDFGDRSGPDWSLGLTATLPLDRRVDRARLREAQRGKRQTLLSIKRTERDLYVTLDQVLLNLRDAEERMELVRESVRLAEEALRAEERRLESGLTTTFNVLNQQRELSQAQSRALAAEVDWQRSKLDLRLMQGNLSESLGFAFNP